MEGREDSYGDEGELTKGLSSSFPLFIEKLKSNIKKRGESLGIRFSLSICLLLDPSHWSQSDKYNWTVDVVEDPSFFLKRYNPSLDCPCMLPMVLAFTFPTLACMCFVLHSSTPPLCLPLYHYCSLYWLSSSLCPPSPLLIAISHYLGIMTLCVLLRRERDQEVSGCQPNESMVWVRVAKCDLP